MRHDPVEQVAVALARLQPCPHAPQFDALESWHDPLQHSPPRLLPHLLPHVLQLFGSASVGVSHPLSCAFPSQFPQFVLHAIEHAPSEHDGVPFVLLHAVPQLPQWLALVWVLTSQPFASVLSQFP